MKQTNKKQKNYSSRGQRKQNETRVCRNNFYLKYLKIMYLFL
jgi:hypothetical protein